MSSSQLIADMYIDFCAVNVTKTRDSQAMERLVGHSGKILKVLLMMSCVKVSITKSLT